MIFLAHDASGPWQSGLLPDAQEIQGGRERERRPRLHDAALPVRPAREYDEGFMIVMTGWWQDVAQTVRDEFSDLGDPARLTRIVVRLLLAATLGGVLGFERERKQKAAGLRTHMLVCVGAALLVLIPQQSGAAEAEISRVVQGVVTGIGFLGAGTIIKGTSEEQVQGLTTAAGIWLTAAIGVAAGVGREATAVLSTLLALVTLSVVGRIARHFGNKQNDSEKPAP